jgi:hypothetical protein
VIVDPVPFFLWDDWSTRSGREQAAQGLRLLPHHAE